MEMSGGLGVRKTWMIAQYLRTVARWRLDRAEHSDGGRNARAAIGLIDAAAYVWDLDESDRIVIRLTIAGCFMLGRFQPGLEGERIIRFWHYEDGCGGPAELLDEIAAAAERVLVPRPRARV
jgi:hypothetical protein